MTTARRRNLDRLLRPRHVALIGGRDAEIVAGECRRIGYAGPVWPVNPKRATIGDHRCLRRIEDLPEAPDAVFLAVPRDAAIETVAGLARMGAGGVVCYAAGFGELGPGEGRDAEARLVAAAGDMALVGPNCFGVINYLDRIALWPFAHGGSCPGYGAAIVTQSGMLSSDICMTQRSLPFAYMISAGNQAVLALEDFLEALVDHPAVRAVGLHIEGLRSIATFADAAEKALGAGKPVVALKTGTSSVGARLTESHTGSLAGSDALYDALFERVGVVRVRTPSQLVETLKLAAVAGMPRGRRVAGFTGSGGGATMLADLGEAAGLAFPAPSAAAASLLRARLPAIATVSNPLDYTTAVWGDPERLTPVLDAALSDPLDAAIIVQDYPPAGLDESKPLYRNDTLCFIAATRAKGIPAAVCSTLHENLDPETRELLVREGVAPMQGFAETVEAVAGLARVAERMKQGMAQRLEQPRLRAGAALTRLDEWEGKALLRQSGLPAPDGRLVAAHETGRAAEALGFPVALKLIDRSIAHKTEAGAVALGLASRAAVEAETAAMQERVLARHPSLGGTPPRFLVERMAPKPVAELLVGIRNDPVFGLAMTLASGGILAELVGDAVTLLLPADASMLDSALARLRLSRLLDGYRGAARADRGKLIEALAGLASYALANAATIAEIEINPLLVLRDGVAAVDALVATSSAPDDGQVGLHSLSNT